MREESRQVNLSSSSYSKLWDARSVNQPQKRFFLWKFLTLFHFSHKSHEPIEIPFIFSSLSSPPLSSFTLDYENFSRTPVNEFKGSQVKCQVRESRRKKAAWKKTEEAKVKALKSNRLTIFFISLNERNLRRF